MDVMVVVRFVTIETVKNQMNFNAIVELSWWRFAKCEKISLHLFKRFAKMNRNATSQIQIRIQMSQQQQQREAKMKTMRWKRRELLGVDMLTVEWIELTKAQWATTAKAKQWKADANQQWSHRRRRWRCDDIHVRHRETRVKNIQQSVCMQNFVSLLFTFISATVDAFVAMRTLFISFCLDKNLLLTRYCVLVHTFFPPDTRIFQSLFHVHHCMRVFVLG